MKHSQLTASANYALEEISNHRKACISVADRLLAGMSSYLGASSEMIYAIPENADIDQILKRTADLRAKNIYRFDGKMNLRYKIYMPIHVGGTFLNFFLPVSIRPENNSFSISILVAGEECKITIEPTHPINATTLAPLFGEVFSLLNNSIVNSPQDVLSGKGSASQQELVVNFDSILRA